GTIMTTLSTLRQRWFSRFLNMFRQRRRTPKRTGPPARFLPRLEPLEPRWVPATININGSVTLDESLGLQNIGSPAPGGANDNDVSIATLQTGASAFYNRLFNSVATGGLALSLTFPTANGVAESAANLITVSGGTVSGLGFVDGNGGALPVYAGVPTGGVAT